MEITSSKLSNYILFSNKNLEKCVRSLINESSNAVLLETYNDKLLLADHNSGAIYLADYNFDGKILTVENYESVDVVNDKSNLREAIENYFDSDGYDVGRIIEAYEEDSEAENTDLRESIVEALASKKQEIADYSQLEGINEEIGEVKDMPFFKAYTEYLTESPTSSIKYFNWVDPVKVSIIDEDATNIIVSGSKDKAKDLSKDKEFKSLFAEAARELMEGNSIAMEELLEDNSAILALDNVEMKEFIGMSVVGDKTLMENRKEIIDAVNEIIEENEDLQEMKTLFEEDNEEEEAENKELATSDKDIDALKDALDKAAEKISDEAIISKINALKDALDSSKDSGSTDVGTVKECVELLSF